MEGYTAPLTREAAVQYLREVHGWSQTSIDAALGEATLRGSYGNDDILHGLKGYYIRNKTKEGGQANGG